MMSFSPEDFEENVRRVARNLFPQAPNTGATIKDGRERDGVFETLDAIHIIAATLRRDKKKIEDDAQKSADLAKSLRDSATEKFVKIWIITGHPPTAEQNNAVINARKRFKLPIVIETFDQFSNRIVDGRAYLEKRRLHQFGSVRDPRDERKRDVPEQEYIPQTVFERNENTSHSADIFAEELFDCSGVFVLLGDYGSGKSMTLRHTFYKLDKKYHSGQRTRLPLYLNLREHFGQSDPAEAILRHSQLIGFESAASLTAAWRAGFVDVILDGFDELSSARMVRGPKKLRQARRQAVSLVNNFIDQTPPDVSVLVSGRLNYFDTDQEMHSALGLPRYSRVFSLSEFSYEQVKQYLQKKGLSPRIPDWLPTRPLLLGYLTVQGLLDDDSNDKSLSALPQDEGWNYLVERICEREAKQIDPATIDPNSVREFIERLATYARQTTNGRGPINLRDIDDVYRDVFGYRPDETAEVFILRLPGFTSTDTDDDSREFIDDDFVDACRAGDIVRYIQAPYTIENGTFADITYEMDDLGVRIASLRTQALSEKNISSVLDASSQKLGNPVISLDIVRVMEYSSKNYIGNGVSVEEGIFRSFYYDTESRINNVTFYSCVFGSLEVSIGPDSNKGLSFRNCYFENVYGVASERELTETLDAIDCEIGAIVDEAKTNSDVFDLDLPMGAKVLITVLRKLFLQKGGGRKESAFYRGIDQRAKAYVPEVLRLVSHYDFAQPYIRRGPKIWTPNRSHSSDARRIIQAPQNSTEPIIEQARKI